MSSCVEHVLKFCFCYGETQFLGVFFNNLVGNVLLPNLVTHLIKFFFGEIVTLHGELHYVLILFNEFLELLNVDFLTHDFADLLACLAFNAIARTESFFGNECKKAERNDDYQRHAFASDFS